MSKAYWKSVSLEEYHSKIMEQHKEKMILEFKQEREKLKIRIKKIEQELDGMGVRNFELTDKVSEYERRRG